MKGLAPVRTLAPLVHVLLLSLLLLPTLCLAPDDKGLLLGALGGLLLLIGGYGVGGPLLLRRVQGRGRAAAWLALLVLPLPLLAGLVWLLAPGLLLHTQPLAPVALPGAQPLALVTAALGALLGALASVCWRHELAAPAAPSGA